VQPAVSQSRAGWLLIAIAVLAVFGILLSAISLQRHYAKSDTTFCDFTQKFSCDIVNRSEYSEIAGIPVAAIGVAGYAALFLLSTLWKSREETPTRMLVAAVAGLLFALYLTYIEAYQLKTWCILCLGSQLVIFLIAMLSAFVKLNAPRA